MFHYNGSSGNTREEEDSGITNEIELMIFSIVVDAISRNWEVKGSAILKGWVESSLRHIWFGGQQDIPRWTNLAGHWQAKSGALERSI